MKIFEVDRVGGFRVSVDIKQKPASLLQCYQCQQYKHVQFRCTSKEVCAFCAEERYFRSCENAKGRGQATRCVNCKSDHPSFFKSCPKHPKQLERQAAEERARRVQGAGVITGVSFSAIAGVSGSAGLKSDQRIVTNHYLNS